MLTTAFIGLALSDLAKVSKVLESEGGTVAAYYPERCDKAISVVDYFRWAGQFLCMNEVSACEARWDVADLHAALDASIH